MYNLELEKAVSEIKKTKAKRVLIQLADGLKPKAKEIQEILQKNTNSEIIIWGGSCFGSCDIPLEAKNLNIDLILQWGHSL
jgi:2-(3-amino-3-carboxypropyl)histidine synthase